MNWWKVMLIVSITVLAVIFVRPILAVPLSDILDNKRCNDNVNAEETYAEECKGE